MNAQTADDKPPLTRQDLSDLSGLPVGALKTYIARRQMPFQVDAPFFGDEVDETEQAETGRGWGRYSWDDAFATLIAAELATGNSAFEHMPFPAAAKIVKAGYGFVLDNKYVLNHPGARQLFVGYAWYSKGGGNHTGTLAQIAEQLATSKFEPNIDQTSNVRALSLVNINRGAHLLRERAAAHSLQIPQGFWS